MPEYLTPGVYFESVDTAPPVRGVRTDIAGFVGLAERGPLHRPLKVESWRQFQTHFGSFVPYGFLAYAVKGFFENDGRTAYVVRVAGSDAAGAKLVLKNGTGAQVMQINARSEGRWGNKVAITLQTRPSAREFSLQVTRDGQEHESFSRLSVYPDEERFFLRVINEGDERTAPSKWVTAEIPAGAPAGDALMPDAQKSGLSRGVGLLSGGTDGLASLKRQDFLGERDPLATGNKGLGALSRVDAVGVVCVPDIHIQPAFLPPKPPPPQAPPHDPCLPSGVLPPPAIPPDDAQEEQPPAFTRADVSAVERALVEHCELLQDRVAILDAPVKTGGGALSVSEIQQWRRELDSARGYAALYYPWVKVLDPLRLGGSPVRAVPPCGHIAGLYARTDLTVGVHKAPANVQLNWAEDVTAVVGDEAQGVLNPEGINCVRAFPGRGIRVYGARTISSDPDWRYVNVRRLLLMIEEAVDQSTQWAVFEPHDFNLRQMLVWSISGFLETIWRQGALAGAAAGEAFFVRCDETNNPQESVDRGRVIADIGVAPTHPAEFIVFRVGRTVEELEVVER